jgi:hypothetical protein
MSRTIHFHIRPKEQAPKPDITRTRVPVEQETKDRRNWRLAAFVAAVAIILLIALVEIARAGGPQYVAGVSYFDKPSAGGLARALQIEVMASTGAATPLQNELSVPPLLSPATGASTGMARRRTQAASRYQDVGDSQSDLPGIPRRVTR